MKSHTPVLIAEYSSEWPARFEAERTRLESLLTVTDFQIDHIGSTAVPGLPAKSECDIKSS
jgi:GrpB-like predicted nucleotidyltransferase (UPF0157 family)